MQTTTGDTSQIWLPQGDEPHCHGNGGRHLLTHTHTHMHTHTHTWYTTSLSNRSSTHNLSSHMSCSTLQVQTPEQAPPLLLPACLLLVSSMTVSLLISLCFLGAATYLLRRRGHGTRHQIVSPHQLQSTYVDEKLKTA